MPHRFAIDALKASILDDIKSKIENTNTPENLKKLKDAFKQTAKYQVLYTAQGKATQILQRYKLKNTSSINKLNQMFKDQEDYLNTEMTCQNKPH